MPNTADLREEIAALKEMLIAADARDLRKDERIERLKKLVAAFKHAALGRRSEKSDLLPGNRLRANDERAEQFELALEDLETAITAIHAEEDAEDRANERATKPRAANRGSLPKHLPRIEEVTPPASMTCPCIAKLRFTAVRVLISIVPPLQIGWAAPLLSCALSSTPSWPT